MYTSEINSIKKKNLKVKIVAQNYLQNETVHSLIFIKIINSTLAVKIFLFMSILAIKIKTCQLHEPSSCLLVAGIY